MELNVLKYISENVIVLIPVLYILGVFLKRLEALKDKYIPFVLLAAAILLCIGVNEKANVNAVIQGVLITGVTVLGNQMYIQTKKED